MNTRRHFALLIASSLALHAHADEAWRIGGSTVAWSVEGSVTGANDISGAASIQAGRGVLVSDELRVAQPFRYDLTTRLITVETPVPLLAGIGKELDLEAIAASRSGACYYATGSHGVARKSGKVQPDRLHVFRLPVDVATGAIKAGSISVSTLLPVLKSAALLRDAIGKSSDLDGIDIEGLAEKDGTLFFGLRSPSLAGHALIIEVQAEALFAHAETATHRIYQLALGAGVGIRDIAAVHDGFVLIAGRSGNNESMRGFTLHHWSGPGGVLTKIGDLPAATGKAEGLMVLAETDTAVDVLIVFDGAVNGTPTRFEIIKPATPSTLKRIEPSDHP
jgi:hypothetical protein